MKLTRAMRDEAAKRGALSSPGIFRQRHGATIGASLREWLPGPVRLLVERRAA